MAIEQKTGLTFWPPGAMQPDLLFNALLYWLAAWAQPIVLAIEDDPPGSPTEGDAYLVGVGTGAWAGHDDSLAYWDGTTWLLFAPLEGYEARNLDTGDLLVYEGSGGWSVAPGGLSDAPIDGVTYGRKDGAWEPTASGGVNVQSTASTATLTPTFANDIAEVTAQAAALTIANPTGTPVDGWGLVVRIQDDGTPRALTWGADFRAIGVTLPTTTVSGKQHYIACVYNDAASAWDVLAVAVQA